MDSSIYAILDTGLDNNDRSRSVSSITFSGSETVFDNPNAVLHWCLYIMVSDGQRNRSIRLDMQPGGGNDLRTGYLTCKSIGYLPINAVAEFTVWPLQSITVDAVMSLLIQNGFTNFRFNSRFEGCRHWCTEVIRFLEGRKLLKEGSVNGLEEYVRHQNQLNPFRAPLPISCGNFY